MIYSEQLTSLSLEIDTLLIINLIRKYSDQSSKLFCKVEKVEQKTKIIVYHNNKSISIVGEQYQDYVKVWKYKFIYTPTTNPLLWTLEEAID